MPSFRLNRRAVLRGAGGVAIALPWLEIMGGARELRAQALPARRLVSVFTPGGTVLDQWTPSGGESDFVLSPILSPFEPVKDSLLVLNGIDMQSAQGEQNASGMVAWLSGTVQVRNEYASGPSIDQVLAPVLSAGQTFTSLELAVRWGTGRCRGQLSPWDVVNFANDEAFTPIAPRLDPVATFSALFGGVGGTPSDPAWDRSVLDAVRERYQRLAARLGAADKQRLEHHLSSIRDLERTLAENEAVSARCRPPALIDTSDYDPAAGLNATDNGLADDPMTDAAIPKVGKLMMESAYLLAEMAKVDMGGHSLLDESVVFFGSNVQDPATHVKTSMPFLLGGRGGGLRAGRNLTYDHPSHNDLLVSLL
jgi:hypothetical protein